MATTRFYLDRRSTKKDGTHPLKISIAHKGKTSLISLGVFLLPEQWNDRDGKIIGVGNKTFLNNFILKRKIDIDSLILNLSENGVLHNINASQIRDKVISELVIKDDCSEMGSFVRVFNNFISQKTKPRTKEIYNLTLSRLHKFCPNLDTLEFESINKDWLISFDNFLSQTSPSKNARNIHLRNIRAVFNYAIDEEITSFYPFRKFKIKGEPTMKRSLSVEMLRKLFSFPVEEHQEKYLDIFKLIFFLIGINTVDLLYLSKQDIFCDRICYRRAKTGRLYSIKIEPEAKMIIEKYRGKSYLLDVMDRYANHRDYVHRLNENLQQIGEISYGKQGKKIYTPLVSKLTTYWARHSWATIAAELDIPKETIAAALGHGGNTVTDIYIDFDRKKVDEANRRVLDWVLYGKR